MADLVAINDVYEIKFVCKGGPQYGINVRHFRVSAGITGTPNLVTAIAAISAKFAPLYKACLAVNASFVGCSLRRLLPSKTLEYPTTADAGPGLATGDMMSTQTCGLISLRTPIPGRKYRGRAYIPFASESDNDATGRPLAAYTNRLASLGVPMASEVTYTLGADSFKMKGVIYHRSTGFETTIDAFYTRSDWATQRRRAQVNRPDRGPFGM